MPDVKRAARERRETQDYLARDGPDQVGELPAGAGDLAGATRLGPSKAREAVDQLGPGDREDLRDDLGHDVADLRRMHSKRRVGGKESAHDRLDPGRPRMSDRILQRESQRAGPDLGGHRHAR